MMASHPLYSGYHRSPQDGVAEMTDTPKPLKDMDAEEIGKMVLHETQGGTVEMFKGSHWATKHPSAPYDGHHYYRIRPEPKQKTVTLLGRLEGCGHPEDQSDANARLHRQAIRAEAEEER